MDIRFFIGQTDTSDIKDDVTSQYKKIYVDMINEFVKTNIINLSDFSYMMEFYKNNGTITGMEKFSMIVKKINIKCTDINIKNQFNSISRNIFSHLYDIINGDELKGKNNINIEKVSKCIIETNEDIIEFTKDQKIAIQDICYFLYDPNNYCFILKGYAGTGKTTIITKLINYLVTNNYIKSVALTAPTNKAVNVIKSKFRDGIFKLAEQKIRTIDECGSFNEKLDQLNKLGTRIDFFTIHKLLDYKCEYDAHGHITFRKGNKSLIKMYDLIVIDECSMIQAQVIYDILSDLRKMNKTHIKKIPKILFVGDPAQLPPVDERVSVIFSNSINDLDFGDYKRFTSHKYNEYEKYPQKKIKEDYLIFMNDILNIQSVTLKYIMRSNNNNVTGLCNNIRSWVMQIIDAPELREFRGNNVKLYKYSRGSKLNTKWFSTCLKYFKEHNSTNNIILTWTNPQSIEYNNKIRQMLFNKEKPNKFEVGDILILNDFYNIEETEIEKDNKKKFYTSEQIKVTNINHIIKTIPLFSSNLSPSLRSIKNYSNIEAIYKRTINLINKKINRKYDSWKLDVARLIEDNDMTINKIYVIKDKSNNILKQDKEHTSNAIKKFRNSMMRTFADRIDRIDNEIIKPLWKDWGRKFVDPFANVNYGISITTHKAQGSGYYNVFVDAHDILKNKSANEAKRCIYTAVTRTSNEVHILI